MLKLRKHKNGKYYAHGTINGQRIRKALKTREKREAEQERSDLEYGLRNQAKFARQGSMVFEVAAVKYVEDGGEARFLVKISKAFKGRDVGSIKKGEIREMARKLYPLAANSTLNRQVITPTQAVINYVADNYETCANIKVKSFDETKVKSKPITRIDLDKLRSKCNPYLSAILLYNFQTGSRVGNTLEVVKVDLDNGTIEYETTKNGDPFTVYLTDEMISILKVLPPRNGRIFGYRSKSSARKAMKKATIVAGLPYRKFHELGRHSFATFFAKKNWNPKKIADAGGWKTVAMVNEVYTSLEDSGRETRDEFNQIGKKMAKKNKRGI